MALEISNSEEKRNIYIPYGVLPQEEPMLDVRIHEGKDIDKYHGVRIPLSFYKYLSTADSQAEEIGTFFKVVPFGIGRIVAEYGVSAVRRIFEGNGTSEQQAFVERIIKLENIRNAVAQAVAEIIPLKRFAGVYDVMDKMRGPREDASFRDNFLTTINTLSVGADEHLIDFFGSRRAFQDAMVKALPARLRRTLDREMDPAKRKEMEQQYILYPLTEGVLAERIIATEEERSDKRGKKRYYKGIYKVARGGYKIQLDGGREQTPSECLKEAIIARLHSLTNDDSKRDELNKNWCVDPAYNGLAFYTHKTGGGKSAEYVDPYYADDFELPDEDDKTKPVRILANPWIRGFITDRMKSGTGGIMPGQAEEVARGLINPLIKPFLRRNTEKRSGSTSMRCCLAEHEFESLINWINGRETGLVPSKMNIDDYNNFVRALCSSVGERAREIAKATIKT